MLALVSAQIITMSPDCRRESTQARAVSYSSFSMSGAVEIGAYDATWNSPCFEPAESSTSIRTAITRGPTSLYTTAPAARHAATASGESRMPTPFEPRPFCTAGAAPRKTKPSSSISSRPVLHVSCSPAEKPERRRRASIASVRALSVFSPRAFCEKIT